MGCNASKLPPNTVVEVPTSVAPRASKQREPAKTMSDESFPNRLDDCLNSFVPANENNSFKPPELSHERQYCQNGNVGIYP